MQRPSSDTSALRGRPTYSASSCSVAMSGLPARSDASAWSSFSPHSPSQLVEEQEVSPLSKWVPFVRSCLHAQDIQSYHIFKEPLTPCLLMYMNGASGYYLSKMITNPMHPFKVSMLCGNSLVEFRAFSKGIGKSSTSSVGHI